MKKEFIFRETNPELPKNDEMVEVVWYDKVQEKVVSSTNTASHFTWEKAKLTFPIIKWRRLTESELIHLDWKKM